MTDSLLSAANLARPSDDESRLVHVINVI